MKKPVAIKSKMKKNIDNMSQLAKFGVEPEETKYVYNKHSKDLEDFTISANLWAKAIVENKALVHIDFSFN
jgi:hypothetical protein